MRIVSRRPTVRDILQTVKYVVHKRIPIDFLLTEEGHNLLWNSARGLPIEEYTGHAQEISWRILPKKVLCIQNNPRTTKRRIKKILYGIVIGILSYKVALLVMSGVHGGI